MSNQLRSLCPVLVVSVCLAACSGDQLGGHNPEPEEDIFYKAQTALSEGNMDQAVEYLQQSIETKPTIYAHYLRAKLLESLGRVDEAIKDCEAGLQLPTETPDDLRDLEWLLEECKKPQGQRFKGANAAPPSQRK